MSAEEALNQFLSGALQKQYKDRYRSLIQTKKGKQRFLSDLWHQFESKINESKTVKEFPSKVWTLPAYSFSENNGFGQKEYSMQNAFDSVGDGSLIIDSIGKYGIHQPEDMVDDIKYMIL